MDKCSGRLTVYFEQPFWIGVFERISEGKLTVCKVTFGAEPKEQEVWEFILRRSYELNYSPAVEINVRQTADNPKRRQREARKQLCNTGIGTKSQQAMKMQQEAQKHERKQNSRKQKDLEKQRQFDQKQQKRKEKHKGH